MPPGRAASRRFRAPSTASPLQDLTVKTSTAGTRPSRGVRAWTCRARHRRRRFPAAPFAEGPARAARGSPGRDGGRNARGEPETGARAWRRSVHSVPPARRRPRPTRRRPRRSSAGSALTFLRPPDVRRPSGHRRGRARARGPAGDRAPRPAVRGGGGDPTQQVGPRPTPAGAKDRASRAAVARDSCPPVHRNGAGGTTPPTPRRRAPSGAGARGPGFSCPVPPPARQGGARQMESPRPGRRGHHHAPPDRVRAADQWSPAGQSGDTLSSTGSLTGAGCDGTSGAGAVQPGDRGGRRPPDTRRRRPAAAPAGRTTAASGRRSPTARALVRSVARS